ncbi:MAG: BON domain-containing protein [Planctomycetes bacterium]|nr:BON domain-containing protein [Planctomycetota bacterium]
MAVSRKSKRLSRAGLALEKNAVDRELRVKIAAQTPSEDNRRKEIKVDVRDGYVVLSGFVRTFREKERLHRFVMGLRGVKALKDLLRVRPEESIADRQIALHVRQALDAHAELPPATATVHVRDGTCTLRGHVRSAEERHIAESVSSHCRGVKSVVNELTVDTLDEIPDEATSRAVRCALAYCEDFDTDGITISCCDGKIVLRGNVPTMMDRMLAEEMTRIQPGVRHVENHIQVNTQLLLEPIKPEAGDARTSRRSVRKRRPSLRREIG